MSRVVVGRELSVRDISRVSAGCGAEVEAFVHGALCVSYSGQVRQVPDLEAAGPAGSSKSSRREHAGQLLGPLLACRRRCCGRRNTDTMPSVVRSPLQCYSSEAWGGRSANRGQCAQVGRGAGRPARPAKASRPPRSRGGCWAGGRGGCWRSLAPAAP